ncbi:MULTISPECIES: Mut7-C RNAse domain-containing protein [Vulcanisaeta]|uniref:Mut7-C RNAse domain-containing protein n=1 Tax=Vulcanisaeta TaxID=164450 RepID=UPI0006CF2111|nr:MULTISPECIES: Mut7-C RNAse domain-containing protein [Vulcanisaeta]
MEVARLNACVDLPISDDEVVVDSMLGWLVRWLRILGVRVTYNPSFDDYYLLNVGHVLVTKDRELFRRRTKLSLLLITSGHVEWLSILSLVLGFPLVLNMERSLCPICGSRLIKVSKDLVIDKVPQGVLLRHSEFWLCTGCGKVYWVGSHHARMGKELEIARGIQGALSTQCINGNLLVIRE